MTPTESTTPESQAADRGAPTPSTGTPGAVTTSTVTTSTVTTNTVTRGTVARGVPGPAPMPLLGWRGNLARYFRNPIATMLHLRESYGPVVCLARGGNDPMIFRPLPEGRASTVFAFGAAQNREVLTQPDLFESDVVRAPAAVPWLGDNMVAANREERARQRKTIMPAFTAGHLKAYYDDVVALTDEMLAGWKPGERINLNDEVEDLAAAIASKTFYGQDLKDEPRALAAIAREVSHALFSVTAKVPINLPGTPYRRFLDLSRQAEEVVGELIEGRRAEGARGDDVLSMMLRAIEEGNVEISPDHLLGNAFTLFLAGHDVPANALGFTFLLLAQHPRVMADLLDELDAELGGGVPSYEQVWKLPVLDSVVKESMRVLSPATIIWRRPTRTATLGGHEIPAGTEVLISPYVTHVDPDVYAEPRRFQPERWSRVKPSPFEYLPFSYGARKCLGAAFAEMMLRLVTSMVVQRFRLELIPKTKVDLTVTMTMKPRGGLPVVVRAQDREHARSRAELRGYLNRMVDFRDA